jgi:hypothetical protein
MFHCSQKHLTENKILQNHPQGNMTRKFQHDFLHCESRLHSAEFELASFGMANISRTGNMGKCPKIVRKVHF